MPWIAVLLRKFVRKMNMSVLMCAQRLRSFDKAVIFHQRRAISTDLNDLLSNSFESSPSLVSHTLSSISSSPSMETVMPPSVLDLPIGERKVCQVQFKHVFRHYSLPISLNHIGVGEFVMVQSFVDKSQEDLGVVTQVFNGDEFEAMREYEGPCEDADENRVGKIFRLASSEETKFLPMKFQREHPLLCICQQFVDRYLIPMTVYGVEYQFDGNVLFVYYVSKDRVDFRPLVKFLIKSCCRGTRIQMKKTNQCREFIPYPFAAEALITGKNCAAKKA